jgi:hypothetical protein
MISFPEGDKIERDEIGDFVEQFVHLKSQESINEEIAEAFAKFDTNDGFVITKADFREILTILGDEPLSNAQADKIIESLGTDSENVNVPGENLFRHFLLSFTHIIYETSSCNLYFSLLNPPVLVSYAVTRLRSWASFIERHTK